MTDDSENVFRRTVALALEHAQGNAAERERLLRLENRHAAPYAAITKLRALRDEVVADGEWKVSLNFWHRDWVEMEPLRVPAEIAVPQIDRLIEHWLGESRACIDELREIAMRMTPP